MNISIKKNSLRNFFIFIFLGWEIIVFTTPLLKGFENYQSILNFFLIFILGIFFDKKIQKHILPLLVTALLISFRQLALGDTKIFEISNEIFGQVTFTIYDLVRLLGFYWLNYFIFLSKDLNSNIFKIFFSLIFLICNILGNSFSAFYLLGTLLYLPLLFFKTKRLNFYDFLLVAILIGSLVRFWNEIDAKNFFQILIINLLSSLFIFCFNFKTKNFKWQNINFSLAFFLLVALVFIDRLTLGQTLAKEIFENYLEFIESNFALLSLAIGFIYYIFLETYKNTEKSYSEFDFSTNVFFYIYISAILGLALGYIDKNAVYLLVFFQLFLFSKSQKKLLA